MPQKHFSVPIEYTNFCQKEIVRVSIDIVVGYTIVRCVVNCGF